MTNKRKGMTDQELQQKLKDTRYARDVKNYFSAIDTEYTKEIREEFKARKIEAYVSETVDANITTGESKSSNTKKILKDYPLEQLHSMGVLKIDLEKLQKKTGKTNEEMEIYITKKPGKSQLNIKPKPEVSEEMIEEAAKKIFGYPF